MSCHEKKKSCSFDEQHALGLMLKKKKKEKNSRATVTHRGGVPLTGGATESRQQAAGRRKEGTELDWTELEVDRMDDLVRALKRHPGPSVLLYALLFRVVRHLLRRLPLPKVVQQSEWRSWKWRNLSVSMVHSLLTGPWAVAW